MTAAIVSVSHYSMVIVARTSSTEPSCFIRRIFLMPTIRNIYWTQLLPRFSFAH
jgi:hypothetical protein